MNEQLRERRRKMLRLQIKGVSLKDTVKDLAQEYAVTQRALYHDWKFRKRWLKQLLAIEDQETFFHELLASHQEVQRLAMMEYFKGDNSAARIGALRLVREVNLDFIQLVPMVQTVHKVEELEEAARRGGLLP